MDIFSHGLWGRGLFGYRGYPWLALFFGMFPDLFSFGIFAVIRVFKGTFQMGPPPLDIIPGWVHFNYNISHSFIPALIVIGIIAWRKKDVAFAMLGWPLHIVMDFPFHIKEYFPTQFLWPVSDYSIDGIPWSDPIIWYPNWAGIILLIIFRFKQQRD